MHSYTFSREILSRHRPIKLHHAYPFYLNFYFSRNFSLSGICLYRKSQNVSSYLLNELVNFRYCLSVFLHAKRRKYHWTIVLWNQKDLNDNFSIILRKQKSISDNILWSKTLFLEKIIPFFIPNYIRWAFWENLLSNDGSFDLLTNRETSEGAKT